MLQKYLPAMYHHAVDAQVESPPSPERIHIVELLQGQQLEVESEGLAVCHVNAPTELRLPSWHVSTHALLLAQERKDLRLPHGLLPEPGLLGEVFDLQGSSV
jgi:hypothetical protein